MQRDFIILLSHFSGTYLVLQVIIKLLHGHSREVAGTFLVLKSVEKCYAILH